MLYRDDALSVFKSHNVLHLFKEHHLNLEIKSNLKIMEYLDIRFDLITGLFKPYNKTNNIPRYVKAKSNHPPSMLKEIPKFVSKHITWNSCNKQVSNAAASFYNHILDKCGYSEKLTLEKEQHVHERRNDIW